MKTSRKREVFLLEDDWESLLAGVGFRGRYSDSVRFCAGGQGQRRGQGQVQSLGRGQLTGTGAGAANSVQGGDGVFGTPP